MLFQNTFGNKQQAIQSSNVGRHTVYNKGLTYLFHFRQMIKTMELAAKEIENLKARLSQLEKTITVHNSHDASICKDNGQSGPVPASSTPPLPISELQQLSEMAKRFK